MQVHLILLVLLLQTSNANSDAAPNCIVNLTSELCLINALKLKLDVKVRPWENKARNMCNVAFYRIEHTL